MLTPKGLKSICGTGLTTAKLNFCSHVWETRHELHQVYLNCDDALDFWNYLIDNVKGLAIVKAAFATQLTLGEMSCLDVHNLAAAGMQRSDVSGSSKVKRKKYLTALEDIGKTSEQHWDDWCTFIAHESSEYENSPELVSMLHSKAILNQWDI